MIKGVGIDMVEIPRFQRAVERWKEAFLNRIFTQKEIDYSMQKRFPYQHLAARFAVKEAVIKAFGDTPIMFKEIEISNDKFGKPSCHIRDKSELIHISIAHTHDYAIATAVI